MPDFLKVSDFTDKSVLEKLITTLDKSLQARFLTLVSQANTQNVVDSVTALLEVGRNQEAFQLLENTINPLVDDIVEGTITSAQAITGAIGNAKTLEIGFDRVNMRAVLSLQADRLAMVTQINNTTREVLQDVLVEGVRVGSNPRDIARDMTENLGLTRKQNQAVANYRRLLENGDSAALTRRLRDKRSDGVVLRAIEGEPLTQKQINRMVDRYRTRYVKYRSEVIARTEALRAAHEGSRLAYNQAIESGTLDPDELNRDWLTARSRVRESHDGMHDQRRGYNDPFISDAGNTLMYPGDRSAPLSETAQCRCRVVTTFVA